MREEGAGAVTELAERIAARYAALPQVEAVVMEGSQTSGVADEDSDLDLCVYVSEEIALPVHDAIASEHATHAEVGTSFWEPGDEWVESGVAVDVVFRTTAWIEEQLNRVLVRHEATVGYSTCFWHQAQTAHMLFDRQGWFHTLQFRAGEPYPEPLRHAIVAKNHPILRRTLSSYHHQIALALQRGDLVSLNHRVAALLASYFDILFAVNRLPHPGEKRLLDWVEERCQAVPIGLCEGVRGVLYAAGVQDAALLERVDALLDGLDDLLRAKGFPIDDALSL